MFLVRVADTVIQAAAATMSALTQMICYLIAPLMALYIGLLLWSCHKDGR